MATPVPYQREDGLRAEHELLTAVFDNTEALVLVLDREARVVRFNRTCERVSGYRSEEVVGRSFWELELLATEDLDGVSGVFERLRSGESGVRWENHLIGRDGSRHLIAWSNAVLPGEDGEPGHVLATGIDVTARRAAEDKLRERTEEVALLHRRYTASGLAALIAHELNQPLAAISGYAEACLQSVAAGVEGPQPVAGYAGKIAAEAVRAGGVVNGLRRLLATASPELRAEELNALVRRACELVAPIARCTGVRVRLDLDEQLGAVLASAVQIEHVVFNLARNAIEAIGGAGSGGGEVAISTRDAGGAAQVTVADSGPGIEPDQAERVFEPFFTTKGEGLGMGLPICRTLIGLHDGRLWTELGRGGRFHFTLPFSP